MSKGFTHESQDAKSVEWYTPKWVFEALDTVFDLDPCSPEGGLPWIPTNNFFSKKDDGLNQTWEGKVWCNPPYGKETSKWLNKLKEHGNGIALVFSRTDCKWFHDTIASADAILFIEKRIQFVDGNGLTSKSGSTCGSLLAAYGEQATEDLIKMKDKGFLVTKGVNYERN